MFYLITWLLSNVKREAPFDPRCGEVPIKSPTFQRVRARAEPAVTAEGYLGSFRESLPQPKTAGVRVIARMPGGLLSGRFARNHQKPGGVATLGVRFPHRRQRAYLECDRCSQPDRQGAWLQRCPHLSRLAGCATCRNFIERDELHTLDWFDRRLQARPRESGNSFSIFRGQRQNVTKERKPTMTPVPFFGFAPISSWSCKSGIHCNHRVTWNE